MRKICATIILMLCIISVGIAKDKEKKYSKLAYKDIKLETDDYTIKIENALSVTGEVKFKFTMINKTSGFLVYKPSESKIVVDGNELPNEVTEKLFVVAPNDSRSKVIFSKGEDYLKTKKFVLNLNGVYKVTPDETPQLIEDFKLPASKNQIRTPIFTITNKAGFINDYKVQPVFEVAYNGPKYGVFYPNRVSIISAKGELANDRKRAAEVLLAKGETDKTTLYFLNSNRISLAEMYVKWNDAFAEATPEKIEVAGLEFNIDEDNSK